MSEVHELRIAQIQREKSGGSLCLTLPSPCEKKKKGCSFRWMLCRQTIGKAEKHERPCRVSQRRYVVAYRSPRSISSSSRPKISLKVTFLPSQYCLQTVYGGIPWSLPVCRISAAKSNPRLPAPLKSLSRNSSLICKPGRWTGSRRRYLNLRRRIVDHVVLKDDDIMDSFKTLIAAYCT